jgi:hypothetical protein
MFILRERILNQVLEVNHSTLAVVNPEVDEEVVHSIAMKFFYDAHVGTFGNDNLHGSLAGEGPYHELMFKSLCGLVHSSDCEHGFINGIAGNGLHVVLNEYLHRLENDVKEV